MDLSDYWQDNKRFVLTVIGGLIAFLIGQAIIESYIGSDLAASRGTLGRVTTSLTEKRFTARDKGLASEQNEELVAAVSRLSAAVGFEPRPEFELDPARGGAGPQYFTRVSEVREDLLRRAGRQNIRLPDDLGLPALAPTRDEEIVRHLHALDLIERVVVLAFEAEVERMDRIEIDLDKGLFSRRGVGRVERTRVTFRMSGDSGPLVRLVNLTQTPAKGRSLLIESVDMVPERNKQDEARLELTFLVSRLNERQAEEEE